jgi:hypothetical protein
VEAEGWPQIVPDRFDGEDLRSYRTRADRIREIMTGFRMNRYAGDFAEQKERELLNLQERGPERLSA